MSSPTPIIGQTPLRGMHWPTIDPFLFCAHHVDHYPAGDARMAPKADLSGRNLGSDFSGKDGFSMYHGQGAPGFPQHPHRGFETVTLARSGFIDHSDSMGAQARFGQGDVQWMTAGRGVVHAEMFPLIQAEGPNPAELFQLWMNLPAHDKMVEPSFRMLWSEQIPRHRVVDAEGRIAELNVMAGAYGGLQPPAPPPNSWAAKAENNVAIWTLALSAGARFTLPPAPPQAERVVYLFAGSAALVAGERVSLPAAVQLRADRAVEVVAVDGPVELLLLQGNPIREPVAQQGPFVMNTQAELQQAFADYRRTRFGGWPWPSDDPTHPRAEGRFARHADGRRERPTA
ncbi:MAG: pirin family protein [Deltaproteobacteria bacterium]|nr:pirin family protein [Deltaproteobacteria bacterium]